jgi:hypothetical protein
VAAAQRTAWDTYLKLTFDLLPILLDDGPDSTVNSQLGSVTARVMWYAPLWGEHGPMLVAAVKSAVRLFRAGERGDLIDLLRTTADRLYLLSASRTPPRRDGRGPTTP